MSVIVKNGGENVTPEVTAQTPIIAGNGRRRKDNSVLSAVSAGWAVF